MNTILRRRVAVAALVLTPVLSSCGFSQPTDQVYTPGVGVNERSGTVDVLNALIVSGAEGSGTLVATLVNNEQEESNALTEVSAEGLTFDLAGPVEVRQGGTVSLTDEGQISVEGEELTTGSFVEITFTFERGDTVIVEAPIVARRGSYADIPVPSVAPTSAAPEEESAAE